MKKIIITLIVLTSLLLASCGSKKENNINLDTKKISSQLDENKPLIDVKRNLALSKKELIEIWLTGEKLKKILANQKAWYEIIAHLKWDARKKYILENEVLPSIVYDKDITPEDVKYCHTTDINAYAQCMNLQNIPLEKVLKKIPQKLQDVFKKAYYTSKYSISRKNLLQATSDPIAIEMKKQKIEDMVNNWILTKAGICNQLPEKEVQNYCKSLLEK